MMRTWEPRSTSANALFPSSMNVRRTSDRRDDKCKTFLALLNDLSLRRKHLIAAATWMVMGKSRFPRTLTPSNNVYSVVKNRLRTLITLDMMSILKESSWTAMALLWVSEEELAVDGFAGTETMKLNESEEVCWLLELLVPRVCTYRTLPFSNCRL